MDQSSKICPMVQETGPHHNLIQIHFQKLAWLVYHIQKLLALELLEHQVSTSHLYYGQTHNHHAAYIVTLGLVLRFIIFSSLNYLIFEVVY